MPEQLASALALGVFCLTYILMALFWLFIRHFNSPPAPPPHQVFS